MLDLPQHQVQAVLAGLIAAASKEPHRRLDVRDPSGAVVATVQAHALPTRPKDMPRHLRPKGRLSKRQRDGAKRAKLAAS